jgi:hypothetical protein
VKRGENAVPFLGEDGRQGSGSARRRWQRRRPIGLPEEEGGRPANRAGPPIRGRGGGVGWAGTGEGERWAMARPGGEGERWAAAGPETRNGWIKSFQIFIWNLDFWQTLEICTRRFRRNFFMGILPKIF